MEFANPAMLWFLAGGAIPIILHLLYRQRFRVVHWAAMEFLLAAIRRTQRRLRLEQLLLLLIRLLILTLLALAIARPTLRGSALFGAADRRTHYIFVLDTSYSMRALVADRSAWARARDTAAAIIEKLPHWSGENRVSVLSLCARPEVYIPEANDRDLVLERLREWEPTDQGAGLVPSLELLARYHREHTRGDMVAKIYVLTDLQRIAWTPQNDQDLERARAILKEISHRGDTEVFLFDAAGCRVPNRAIVDVRAGSRLLTTRDDVPITVEVFNYDTAEVRDLAVALEVDGNPLPPRHVTIAAGSRAVAEFTHRFTTPGPHVVTAFLDPPDYLAVDDRRHLCLDVREAVRVLGLDGDPGTRPREGELYAYALALDPFRDGRIRVEIQPRVVFRASELDRADVLVVANVDALSEADADRIAEFVRAGGGLWLVPGDRTDAEAWNRRFGPDGVGLLPVVLEAPFGAGTAETRFHISEVQRVHPIFAAFNDALLGALRSVEVTRAWRLREPEDLPEDAVLARFDDGGLSPALVKNTDPQRTGHGRVLVSAFPLDGDWTVLFAARAVYLPFVLDITTWLARRPESLRNYFVGDRIAARFPVSVFSRQLTLTLPRGGTATVYPPDPEPDSRFFLIYYPAPPPDAQADPASPAERGLEEFGVYRLARATPEGREELLALFACNPPPRRPTPDEIERSESNLDRITPEELASLYPEFRFTLREAEEPADAGGETHLQPEGRGLWRPFLWFALALVALESFVAMTFGRRKR